MIKTFTVTEQSQLKANIILLDGAQYLGRDLPPAPFEVPNCVSFWSDDAFTIIPMNQVKSIFIYADKEEGE